MHSWLERCPNTTPGEKCAFAADQIRMGRSFAKRRADFRSMLKAAHGDDRESVVDADTEAVAAHAKTIGSFFYKPIRKLWGLAAYHCISCRIRIFFRDCEVS